MLGRTPSSFAIDSSVCFYSIILQSLLCSCPFHLLVEVSLEGTLFYFGYEALFCYGFQRSCSSKNHVEIVSRTSDFGDPCVIDLWLVAIPFDCLFVLTRLIVLVQQ
ncbi:hypothetical protein ASPBRDRAFT_295837 [Aspergillus brasiliensis CBS 101740]|uniref:Transmembrane protein n=1 Tax=Aspergillus brasiliensis (strain CBS 101740 / IMI 381727 / IBT 21946) TaxID=767769 RepID=A0A1L9UC36_ASPBC|nr:hypothetical protein ASPBRDRAFT_295837 [Aspergillus brasiliensis CBS 101740]